MNKATVTSAVTHGKLSRRVRQTQPLATVSSTVESGKLNRRPTVSSAVSHGSAYRSLSYSVSFESFQGSFRTQCRRLVLQTAKQASKRLTPPTSVRLAAVLESEDKDKNKTSRSLRS
jgi:hypothetical protein